MSVSLATTAAAPPLDSGLHRALDDAVAQVNGVVLGKAAQVQLAFACFLAGGHLLIEDLPGVGKTTLAHALAATLDLSFSRIQFTADLLPSDIIGVGIYERGDGAFKFHPGPLFAQLVLADEINRATPKAQSALLEAMAEHQVTADGTTHALPEPFFVVATQNPLDLAGTFALPDSQLDRFMLRIGLDYPDRDAERALLTASDRRELIARLVPRLDTTQAVELRAAATRVLVSAALIDYVQALLGASRSHAQIRVGLSPRAGLALLQAARAHALLDGRGYCLPEDVQAVFAAIAAHRLIPAAASGATREDLARRLLEQVAVR
ncbi:MAG: AAA family ATPase [Proteobacteria bacterium]|uniref:AAA family ATPase n=1 Tax=Rudaea sp. TaxID=2136325 RepID=UPI001D5D7356|nr:AAA family ATPase [Pseudomonadota bacterium]MBS0566604.1 AAA family ATPase [Pseudomonadota bacterium]